MSASKKILNVEKPNTQSVKAVCSLLAWKGRPSNPLPSFVEIGSGEARVVLVLSNKKDSYYTCTKSDCSCPAAIYQRGPCKHRRLYFPEQATIHKQSIEETLREADKNLARMPYQYQRMVRAAREAAESEPLELMGGHKPFRPIIEDEVGQKSCTTKTVSSLYVDTLADPTARDLAYHSIQEDKILWPVEA